MCDGLQRVWTIRDVNRELHGIRNSTCLGLIWSNPQWRDAFYKKAAKIVEAIAGEQKLADHMKVGELPDTTVLGKDAQAAFDELRDFVDPYMK